MSEPLICANAIALIRGQRLLFKHLSFALSKGQAIHLSGPNGSGKTSLFKMLIGLLTPSEGQLRVFGQKPKKLTATHCQNRIYLGHQTTLKSVLTVAENLQLSSTIFDNISANEEQLNRALGAVGLYKYKSQPLSQLSAGQKRKVMLARLWLCLDEQTTLKSLWLLDEPLTALDKNMVVVLQQLIDRHLALGGGILFTSHQQITLSHNVQSVFLGELAK